MTSYLLPASNYDQVRPLFQPLDLHLAVAAMLDGSVPAVIHVNDPIRPRAAFARIGHHNFLAGSPREPAFNAHVHQLLAETISAGGVEALVFKTSSEAWEAPLRSVLLPGYEILRAQRQFYRFQALRRDWRAALPASFRLVEIDASLLARTQLAHLDVLRDELCSERPSVEEFLARSFGLAAVCDADAALAGWCTSEYNSGDRCEVGIGVLEPYQRRGLATALGSAFVDLALARGVRHIGWHCWARNLPSVATALAIGYEKVCDYTTFVALIRSA